MLMTDMGRMKPRE